MIHSKVECEPAAEGWHLGAPPLTKSHAGAIMADPTVTKTEQAGETGPVDPTEPPPADEATRLAGTIAREQQRELRQRIKSVASLLIALGAELPDPAELSDPAEAAQIRRLLLRYLPTAQARLAELECRLTGQPRLRWFR
jgi:hypothetical protein